MNSGIDRAGIPEPRSPADGARILASSVQFCWGATVNRFGYELQYSPHDDFASVTTHVLQNLPDSDIQTYMPTRRLRAGNWLWRVRAMSRQGVFGQWSPSRSFTVAGGAGNRQPEFAISPDHPLFVFHSDAGDEMASEWRSLPEPLRAHAVLRVERQRTEELHAVCECAQKHEIPLLIQLAGPHDIYSGHYSRIPLGDVDAILQRFPTVKGVQIVEQSCQGGLGESHVVAYLIGMMRMVASYGRIAVWADGQWHGNNIWIDAALHRELFRAMRECGDWLVPTWKMNCGWVPYAVQGPVYGLWMAGVVSNWGIEPESWYWYEAGFRELDVQHGFKEGDADLCPPPFWGQMILLGLSAGASVYSFEPPKDLWAGQGTLSESLRRVILPLLTRIVEWRLVPGREEVRRKTRIGYVASQHDRVWQSDGGTLKTIFEGTYGVDHPFQMIPRTGRYGWLPILSPLTEEAERAGYAQLLSASSFATAAEAQAFFDSVYPAQGEGSAWSARIGRAWIATNHHENRDIAEDFSLPLREGFWRAEGVLEVNAYVVLLECGDGVLAIHANGRSDRETRLSVLMGSVAVPSIEATPAQALLDARYDETTRTLSWAIHFQVGAVDLMVRAGAAGKPDGP